MKIAKFKNVVHGFIAVSEASLEGQPDYMRISEFVEVDFPPRHDGEMVAAEVAKIDHAISEIMAAAGNKVAALNQRKQELLALTVQA